MANPTWFDYNFYLSAKLAQLQSTDPTNWSGKTVADVETVFTKYGFGGETGAYNHYLQYGDSELVSPSQYLNVAEYYGAKLAQMQKTDPNYSLDNLLAAFKTAGLTAGQHYELYGATEGVNPSNAFDDAKYLSEKLAQLQKTDPTNWSGKTVGDVQAKFNEAGLSPLDHYIKYGKTEGLTPEVVSDPVKPIVISNPGTQYTLTTGIDTIPGTPKDDTITGVASSLSSEATLNAGDKIDGATGNDVLNVTVKGSFSGFTGDGYLKNVETVNLTSDSTVARDFSSAGATGITAYNIDATKAAINLTKVADLKSTISVANQASGTFSVSYADKVTDGTSDAQALVLSAMGKLDADKGNTVIATTINGVETLNVTAKGDNVVNFVADAATTMTVKGAGSLTTDLANAAKVTTFDGSAASGKLNVTMGASSAKTVSLGSGDDTLTAGTNALAVNATITGGAGADTLVLGDVATVQYVMSGVETVKMKNAAAVTFSAKSSSDIANLVVSKDATQSTTFANMGSGDKVVELQGVNAATGGTSSISSDHSGATTLKVTTPAATATEADPSENAFDVTLGNSTSLNMTVDSKMRYTGTVNAAKAESVQMAINGEMNAAVQANAAKSVVVSAVDHKSDLTLNAANATDLTVTASDQFTLKGNGIAALQSMTVHTADVFNAAAEHLSHLSSLTVDGNGTFSVGDLGSNAQDYALSVTASGLAGGFTVGKLSTQNQAITADVSGVLGTTTFGAISAGTGEVNLTMGSGQFTLSGVTGNNVTIDASADLFNTAAQSFGALNVGGTLTVKGAIAANDLSAIHATGASFVGAFTGGAGDDTITVDDTNTPTTSFKLSGDLSSGTNNVVKVTATAAAGATIDITGMSNVTLATLKGGAGDDTITVGNGATNSMVTGNAGADKITLGAGVDKIVYTTLADSLATSSDTITGFATTVDKFIVTAAQKTAIDTAGGTGFVSNTHAGTGNLAVDIATAITDGGTAMIANGASVVTLTSGADAGTYIVLNDATVAFDAALDAVIKVTGSVPVAADFATV